MVQNYLAGVDEAGRGPLAGPVAVGVVWVSKKFDMRLLRGVKDSKQLTPHVRNSLYTHLTHLPGLHWAVVMIGAKVIDRGGINEAIRLTLQKALVRSGVKPRSTLLLLDGGLHAPSVYVHQKTIIRGDQTELLIGAASILAKVTRDKYMVRAHKRYPKYGFALHKGYGTELHRANIQKHGLSPLHRNTFCHIRRKAG
jgi:ribonuclease HII